MCSISTKFDGKTIIITGSSSGIGAAAAIMFAERGGNVTIHGRQREKLDQVAKQIEAASNKKALIVIGDITSETVRDELISKTLEAFGRIDVLVNNAGAGDHTDWQTDFKLLQSQLDLHIIAPLDLSQRCMPELIKNKGNIVMISSVAALNAAQGLLHYGIAKGGMQLLMRGLASDVAKLGVRVNSVNPGYIVTGFFKDDGLKKIIASKSQNTVGSLSSIHPNGRPGQPHEVAELICFLACDGASMITGSTNTVDGGLTSVIPL